AIKAGVNTVPGHAEVLKDARQALSVAKKIGYPVMLKASAGGGGKGMRVAYNESEAREGFASAKREAASSFGDDRIFVEKFIEEPRHIEIQIIADAHGNTIYLGERECSIQRRHQKVVEEAPSPFIDEKTRKKMGEQAVHLARAVKYVSAGTVEFIVDAKRNFYFLEMNTRLQVEHPVTEKITGLDLVELMIRVAAGEKLSFKQEDVTLNGWAMETRVYAEDPFRGFLPSVGRLVRYQAPEESDHVRVDTGVYEGGEISIFYDPMIAKLITYGVDRDEAIAHMRHALDGYYIRGVSHNISFLAALMAHPRFQKGALTTNFIAEEYPDGFDPSDVPHDDPDMLLAVATCVHRAYQERAAGISGQFAGHQRLVHDDWIVLMGSKEHAVHIICVTGGFDVTIGEARLHVRTEWQLGQPLFEAQVNGLLICLQVERNGAGYSLYHSGLRADVVVLNPQAAALYALMPEKVVADTSQFLLSPMPGLLISLSVVEGQEVKDGEELAVIEAMKMENVLHAERDGVIKTVHAATGDSLSVDQAIIEFE
ncbi:MAG: ATP-grasp domain-containing protein, partial [Rhodospirillales bacterium]|nr:ATP-grasp domain-containing protein [Rhodospirillales bacterium]